MTVVVAPPNALESAAARRYGAYVLGLLCVTNALNFGDRLLIGVVQEPLRQEFGLSDLQLGLLGGSAFALLYTVMGLPIARYAERGNRAMIIALAVGFWSGMTALCGLAGSYVQLFLCRIGVSIGEAGCAPPAHSLISDYFPRARRARAMAVYAVGGPLGSLSVTVGAGFIAQQYGWRAAFLVFGLAGLVIAAVLAFTLREPRKNETAAPVVAGFVEACRTLLAKRSMWLVMLGASIAGFSGFFISQYLVSFLMRTHGLSIAQAASVMGAGFGVGGVAGTYFSGVIADHWGRRNDRALALVPAIGCVLTAVFYAPALALSGTGLVVALLLIAATFQNCYMGQSYAIVQALAPDRMRATASALFLLANSIIGFGLGPPLLGALSDALAHQSMLHTGLAPSMCASAASAACAQAKAAGLQGSMLVASVLFLAAAGTYWALGRTLTADTAASPERA